MVTSQSWCVQSWGPSPGSRVRGRWRGAPPGAMPTTAKRANGQKPWVPAAEEALKVGQKMTVRLICCTMFV